MVELIGNYCNKHCNEFSFLPNYFQLNNWKGSMIQLIGVKDNLFNIWVETTNWK